MVRNPQRRPTGGQKRPPGLEPKPPELRRPILARVLLMKLSRVQCTGSETGDLMTQQIDRKRGVVTTYTTFGELLAAVLDGTPNRRVAMAMLDPRSPLQRAIKQNVVLVR
jgi:hypothetical protein